MKLLHFAKVEKGKLVYYNPNSWNKELVRLEGGLVQITIEKRKRPRSNEQNRYYWGVVVRIISDHLGYTPEEAHTALRGHFLTVLTDKTLPLIKSTTDLSTVEFEAYMTKIREWASIEFQMYIPEPNEVDY